MIPLNKPFLPSFSKYQKYLEKMYERVWVTNNGPFVQELKERLEDYLGVENLLPVSSGTAALQLAHRTFNLTGNVVTTPYTFIATSSSLDWLGITPKFADINPLSLNLCPEKANAEIDNQTSAILPVHIYGNPCDVEEFSKICAKQNIKLIFDAAHAFGVNLAGRNILSYGDVSIISFHATKIFHTIEGGAVIFNSNDDYQRAANMINFGIDEKTSDIINRGTNGKMSEAHAAMGLAILEDMDAILETRIESYNYYKQLLGSIVEFPRWHQKANTNGVYFPVLFQTEEQCIKILTALTESKIEARRYFHQSLNTLEIFNSNNSQPTPITEEISKRTLCLPLYYDLTKTEIASICTVLINSLN